MSHLCHLQINASDLKKSMLFYDKILTILGWKKEINEAEMIGYTNGFTWLFICQTETKYLPNNFHRKQTGINHIAFKVESKEIIDSLSEFLITKGIVALYNGAKDYPNYGDNYYAIYFEDPDRLKIEVCYYTE